MSTLNIGFYEEISKIIFELSSNIIKYAPYSFCWFYHEILPPKDADGVPNHKDPAQTAALGGD